MRYHVPHSFRDADVSALSPALVAQVKLSVMLGYGLALSLVGVGGLGSLAAFVIGLRALREINRSREGLSGLRLAWWCILAGGLGAAVIPLMLYRKLSGLPHGGH